jgi:hypothetical protein
MGEPGHGSKPRKQIFFRRAAEIVAGLAVVVFILPTRVFAANWANGLVIELCLIGGLVLICTVFLHLSD